MAKQAKIKFPGFKILDWYITKKFLGTYFFAIVLIIVIVVVFDAVEKMDNFITNRATFTDVIFKYYLHFIPFFINQFGGLFTFIAVIFFTSKMAYQTEIIAILSSGTSFARLMWPYMVSATVITLLSLTLNLYVIPGSNEKRVEFENTFVRPNRAAKFDEHIYRQIYPNTFAYIRKFSGITNKAEYLAIEQYSGNNVVEALEASDLTYNPENMHWTAPKYIIRTFDGEKEDFVRYEKLDTMINLDIRELGRVEDLVKTMKIGELNEFISQQRSKGSDMIPVFEVERQNRFAYPMATFVLTIIGVALSSRKVRGGTGLHIGIGITLCFTYIMFCKFAEEFAKSSSVLPPALMVWLPNIIFAAIAVYLYRKAPK